MVSSDREESARGPAEKPHHGRPWVGITANAHSGVGHGRARVAKLIHELRKHGLNAKVAWTNEDRAKLVREAEVDAGCRCLVAAGGDGTVAALINERPTVPMTVLPAGTENLFAAHFGIRCRPRELAELISANRIVRIDLGQIGARRFSLMAGVGFDADVVTRHHSARTSRSGGMKTTSRAAYVEPVLRSSLEYQFPTLTVSAKTNGEEEILLGTTAFVFNLPRYALGLPIAPTASADDGLLDLIVFREAGSFHALRYLWLVFRGLHLHRPGVFHRRVRDVSVVATQPVPVQLDGDPGGLLPSGRTAAPWRVEVLPAALDVIVPGSYTQRSRVNSA